MIDAPITVVFFGPQGAGKGTQAKLLEGLLERDSDTPVLGLEMGERLRGFAAGSGDASKRVGEVINAGGLLPAFIPSHIITTFFLQEFTNREHLIIDGVARRVEQSIVLDDALQFFGRVPYHVVVLQLPREEAVRRLHGRGRSDDSDDQKIQRRLDWYETETLPAIKLLEERGRTMHYIDARPPIEEIHAQIRTVLHIT